MGARWSVPVPGQRADRAARKRASGGLPGAKGGCQLSAAVQRFAGDEIHVATIVQYNICELPNRAKQHHTHIKQQLHLKPNNITAHTRQRTIFHKRRLINGYNNNGPSDILNYE